MTGHDQNLAVTLLGQLAVTLGIDAVAAQLVGTVNVLDREGMTLAEIARACRRLEATWKYAAFPRPAHFLEARWGYDGKGARVPETHRLPAPPDEPVADREEVRRILDELAAKLGRPRPRTRVA